MFQQDFTLSGNLVDVVNDTICPATIVVQNGFITHIQKTTGREYDTYLIPGLIDAHIHIESSMLPPAEFARLAVVHGTVGVVADPHEIANVLGMAGIRYLIENGKSVPFKFYYGAPSCVPASPYETNGATVDSGQLAELFAKDQLKFLGEMMDYPGVIARNPTVMSKIAVAQRHGRPVDGHAPGLLGRELFRYLDAGISTDHEAFTLDEGLSKIRAGMKILIREGTAARNFGALHPLLKTHPNKVMFCTDDRHPDDLVQGHLNLVIKQALALGYDPMTVIRCATLNPVRHYGLEVGLLQPGDPADFVVIDNLKDFGVLATYSGGHRVAANGQSLIARTKTKVINEFRALAKSPTDFGVRAPLLQKMNVIQCIDGELVTKRLTLQPTVKNGFAVSDPRRDLLKITVVNRYHDTRPAVGFIKGFGLTHGAIASSVAHDSHNIIAIGANDEALTRAVNRVIEARGALVVADETTETVLPLPLAGLMSDADGYAVAQNYQKLAAAIRQLGSPLHDPFMTMSFMALLVIPELKISDRGLFDGKRFKPTKLFGW